MTPLRLPLSVAVRLGAMAVQGIVDDAGVDGLHIKGPDVGPLSRRA